jgi:hypothetical protein
MAPRDRDGLMRRPTIQYDVPADPEALETALRSVLTD